MERNVLYAGMVLLAGMMGFSHHAAAVEVALEFATIPDSESEIFVAPSLTCPEGEWTLPAFESDTPLYYLFPLGDKQHLCVFDTAGEGHRYTRMYFDANADGNLTDDAMVQGAADTAAAQHGEEIDRIPLITTDATVGEASLKYAFSFKVFYYDHLPDAPTQDDIDALIGLSVTSHSAYQGQLNLNGTTYHLAFRDDTVNGRFDDLCTPPRRERFEPYDPLFPLGSGDRCAVTLEAPDLNDWLYYGNQWYIAGTLYDLTLDIPAKKCSLEPVTDATVPLLLDTAVDRMTMITEDYKAGVVLIDPGAAPKLRPATYQLLEYQWQQKDPQGDRWLLAAQASLDTPPVKLSKKGAKLALAEPYVPMVYVPEWSKENLIENDADEADVTFTVLGEAQEVVTNLERIAGTKTQVPLSQVKPNRPSEPRFLITDASGSIVARGAFEYG